MLTDLQKRKLTAQFRLNDLAQSGYMERADFEQFAARICESLGFVPGSPEYNQVHAQTLASWDTEQLKAFDADGDGRVSLAEHLAAYDVTLQDAALFQRLTVQYSQFVFGLWDQDRDGRLSTDEYAKVLWCYGGTRDQAAEAFRRLDRGPIKEFYLSDDPEAPGNWLLGSY